MPVPAVFADTYPRLVVVQRAGTAPTTPADFFKIDYGLSYKTF